jgi:phage-related protein
VEGARPGVFEVAEDHDGDTYRAVDTVRFKEVVYVLHAFQNKSSSGIKTSQIDVDMIERRLKAAQRDYEAEHGQPKR